MEEKSDENSQLSTAKEESQRHQNRKGVELGFNCTLRDWLAEFEKKHLSSSNVPKQNLAEYQATLQNDVISLLGKITKILFEIAPSVLSEHYILDDDVYCYAMEIRRRMLTKLNEINGAVSNAQNENKDLNYDKNELEGEKSARGEKRVIDLEDDLADFEIKPQAKKMKSFQSIDANVRSMKAILSIVYDITVTKDNKVTRSQLIEFFRGNENRHIREKQKVLQVKLYGTGKELKYEKVADLVDHLLKHDYLIFKMTKQMKESYFIQITEKGKAFLFKAS